MKIFMSTGTALAATIALSAGAAPAIATPAAIAPAVHGAAEKSSAHAIQVHSRSYHHRHKRRHGDRHDHVVDAPYAHVETGDRVEVDAPFAHVHVGRHGRHIVAPFVDLWLPR